VGLIGFFCSRKKFYARSVRIKPASGSLGQWLLRCCVCVCGASCCFVASWQRPSCLVLCLW